MRIRAAVIAGLVGLCLTPPADAAPLRTVRFTDLEDDANAVNDQSLCDGRTVSTVTACPRDLRQGQTHGNVEPAADIRAVTVATTYTTRRVKDRRGRVVTTRKANGFKVEYDLAGAPKAGLMYALIMSVPNCTEYEIYYVYYAERPPETILNHDCGGEPVRVDMDPATVRGTTLVIDVPAREAFVRPGTVFSDILTFTAVPGWTPTGRLQFPQYDHADTEQQFRYG